MKAILQRFMIGRYGVDEFGRFLNIAALIPLILGMLITPYISVLALAILAYSYFRMFSRSTYKRAAENAAYLKIYRRVTGWFTGLKRRFAQRKTHRFYKCPSCHKSLRVPRGKGKISITCPGCKTQFIKNT